MEASYPQTHNQRCRIVSQQIQGQRCLQFWYHMYGMDIDVLNVYIKINGRLGKPVWTRARNQGWGFLCYWMYIYIYVFVSLSL